MRYRVSAKLSDYFNKDVEDIKKNVTSIASQLGVNKKRYRLGVLYMPADKVSATTIGDDFVKNVFTLIFEGNGYKVPRILKRTIKD